MPEAAARQTAARQTGFAVAGALLAPLLVRGALIAEQTSGFERSDLAGLCADLASAAGFAALLLAGRYVWRWLPVLLAGAWALAYYAQYETALVLDSIPSFSDLGFLGSRTFVGGSVLWVSSPFVLGGSLIGSVLLVWAGTRTRAGARAALGLVLACVAFVAVHPLIPGAGGRMVWRHASLAEHNATRAISRALWPTDAPGAVLERVPAIAADLSGRSRPGFEGSGQSRQNVLLILLESVSGAYLPSMRSSQGVSGGLELLVLDGIAQDGLRYPNFVAQAVRTNRGLFAALCGELPNLLRGTPKMTAYLSGPRRPCLPRILAGAGYTTAYLQAAPLAFMLKDQFMPKAGFQQVHGHDWFERGYANSVWGVDDRSFFEQSLRKIDELRAGSEPWFLTMLTVGTHHPTIIPRNFQPDREFRFARALAWLDLALESFMRELGERGVLDDTLVILTSDESRGLTPRGMGKDADELTSTLTHNWGYLIVRTPQGARGEVREPYALMDLPVSILDYLGLGDQVSGMHGRSVFREYDDARHLFFANQNLHLVGAFAPDHRLFVCGDGFADCQAFELPNDRLFGSQRKEIAWDGSGDIVPDVARRSVEVRSHSLRPEIYPLVSEPRFEVNSVFAEIVHGGQYVDLRLGQWLEVEIEVDGIGGGQHPSRITHRLTRHGRLIEPFKLEVRPGYRRTLEYTYAPLKDVQGVRVKSLAHLDPGATPMELNFRRARMTVHTIGERPPLGVHVRRTEHRPIETPAVP